MVRVNHVYRICYHCIRTTSCQTTVSVIYIFLFVPDSLLKEHLKLSCGTHSFSLNLNFDFRSYYVIIPFKIEWPDRTSQVSMETVAFAVLCPVWNYISLFS